MTNNDELAMKLKAAAEKATPLNLDSAEIQRGNDGYYECPMCCGAGEIEAKADFCNIDGVALGVQFYGIGEHHGAAEEYFRTASPANILTLLAERDADKKRIAELETVCAESYQVVGALADAAGVFETSDEVSKALDNLSAAKLVHEDVLPFAVEARTVSVKLPDCDYAAVQHMSGGSTDYCNGFVDGTQNAIKCFKADMAAAGINLEVGG